jgi:hypothetical protein
MEVWAFSMVKSRSGVVDEGQGQQQGRDEVEAAAHVVHLVDLRQRGNGFDGEAGGIRSAWPRTAVMSLVGEPGDLFDVELEGGARRRRLRGACRCESASKGFIAFLLKFIGGELGFHNGGGLCRKRPGESMQGAGAAGRLFPHGSEGITA